MVKTGLFVTVLAVVFVGLALAPSVSLAGPEQDATETGRLLAILLDSGRVTVGANQALINDAEKGDKGFTPDVFEKQRKIVMGARLVAVHGIIQRDPDSDVIHVVAHRLEDHTHMLRHLSEDIMAAPLSRGDAPGAIRPPPGRHPRDVEVIPKSRDFH